MLLLHISLTATLMVTRIGSLICVRSKVSFQSYRAVERLRTSLIWTIESFELRWELCAWGQWSIGSVYSCLTHLGCIVIIIIVVGIMIITVVCRAIIFLLIGVEPCCRWGQQLQDEDWTLHLPPETAIDSSRAFLIDCLANSEAFRFPFSLAVNSMSSNN